MTAGAAPSPPDDGERLRDLALDLRWTWSHGADSLWRRLDPASWERAENPWTLLQNIPRGRLESVLAEPAVAADLARLDDARRLYLESPGWFGRTHPGALRRVAYFCMEFGLGEALPLYAGGLGVLAGDFLKAASDLAVPVTGVGLLYGEGYFRQYVDADGRQREVYPYNDPTSLPIRPVLARDGGWLRIPLAFPGRALHLRVWSARVGRAELYLLDSNDPLNSPVDRGITGKLYGGGQDVRLLQEFVLGIAGWRLIEALGLEVDICHLNEGHAALAILERARSYMHRASLSFHDALWVTRAGNIFTTHTPVEAGFDRYDRSVVERHLPYLRQYVPQLGIDLESLLALGRRDPRDSSEPFNMAYLALRGCIASNGVSRLHGEVSREIFRPLFPRWPAREIPVSHITNGVHVPSWDSPWADEIWERSCGKDRWLGDLGAVADGIARLSDEELWGSRSVQRRDLVAVVRTRLARQLGFRGAGESALADAHRVLDPNLLTLGFARRFTAYKRPTLLLRDPDRLARFLTSADRPAQLVVAGKAHPDDDAGRAMVREWVEFARRADLADRVVFLEDYDLTLAQELVRGVDVWLNTPRRPWEACGTSGMKVLANGGLNLSSLDGWWAEAYRPDVGWAIGGAPGTRDDDAADAQRLYEQLEREIAPEFYRRDERGLPTAWVARVRTSMAALAPRYSGNRMLREYVESLYLPAADLLRRRLADGGRLGGELRAWHDALASDWHTLHFGNVDARRDGARLEVTAHVYFGDVDASGVHVELYADAAGSEPPVRIVMECVGAIAGAVNGAVFRASLETSRPAGDFTPRAIPFHPDARVPTEAALIDWPR